VSNHAAHGRTVAWEGSDRKERLPDDWDAKHAAADERNPLRICHWCGRPGSSDLDHIIPGDDHSQDNLDWIHGLNSFDRQRTLGFDPPRNCHQEKTSREAAAARPRLHRPPEAHPALG
jgi:5-methylcytosine-specific restriction enzyme A